MEFVPQSITALAGPSKPVLAPSKSQKRLKADGIHVLEEFQQEHPNVVPDRFQTKVLLDKIRGLSPSYDYYKSHHVKAWFQRRVNTPVSSGEASLGQHHYFPTLNEQALANLAILYQAQNNPSPDVIEVWAKLLGVFGATRQDVIAWVTHRVQMAQGNGQRLLTPSDTTSPEPLASPTDYTFKSDPSQSPILPSLSRISEPHAPHTPYHDSQSKIDPTLQAILAGVAESLQKPLPPPTDVPKSAAEFKAMFAPFEQHMTAMREILSAPCYSIAALD